MLPVRQNLRIFAAKTAHMDIYDIIARRSSVRDYADTPLSAAQVSALEEACAATSAPFGGRVAVRLAHFAEGCARRPGTYGVIHGPRSFLILSTDGSPAARLSAGYEFERILLEATRLGLGTCWMAATFRGRMPVGRNGGRCSVARRCSFGQAPSSRTNHTQRCARKHPS